jgi:hypothetical protein
MMRFFLRTRSRADPDPDPLTCPRCDRVIEPADLFRCHDWRDGWLCVHCRQPEDRVENREWLEAACEAAPRPFGYRLWPRWLKLCLNRRYQCPVWGAIEDSSDRWRCIRWRHAGRWHRDVRGVQWHA